jgi:hypothetical protein
MRLDCTIFCSAAIFLAAGGSALGSGTDAQLIALLRTRSLPEVSERLINGEVPPPLFTVDRALNPANIESLRTFLKALESERGLLRARKVSEAAYAECLFKIHSYFEKFDSYASLLLSDCVKRMLLEWAQTQITSDKNPELARVSATLRSTALRPERLLVLFGDKQIPMPPTESKLAAQDLSEVCQLLWRSHGYENFAGVIRAHAAEQFRTSVLLETYKPLSLAHRILQTEFLRAVWLEGTIAFLERGGDIKQIDLADVRYFQRVIPIEEAQRHGFPVLGVPRLNAYHVVLFTKRDSSMTTGLGSWMTPVFE